MTFADEVLEHLLNGQTIDAAGDALDKPASGATSTVTVSLDGPYVVLGITLRILATKVERHEVHMPPRAAETVAEVLTVAARAAATRQHLP